MALTKTYLPVFAGKTPDGGSIIVYKHAERESELHIQRPDGEFWALNPGSEIETTFEVGDAHFHIKIVSPVWTGTATGTRVDLLEAEAR